MESIRPFFFRSSSEQNAVFLGDLMHRTFVYSVEKFIAWRMDSQVVDVSG